MGVTIHGLLERNARKFSEKEALITATKRLTYMELNQKCNQIAKLFQDKGVGRGERIAIIARNNENFLYAYFALMKLGAIPMPINIRLTPFELIVILQNSYASGICYEDDVKDTVNKIDEKYALKHTISIQSAVSEAACYDFQDLHLPVDSKDVCEILFTSGTTGIPKGVVFNHERMLSVASAVSIEFGLTSDDKMLTLMPLTHSAPLNTFFVSGLYCGCSHVIGEFSPKSFLSYIDEEKTTFAFSAPVAYLLSSKEHDLTNYDLSSMRVFAYGGGPLALASYERVKSAFQNDNFYQVYGLTEAGPNGIILRPNEHILKAGSIGKNPTVNMELRIVRPDGTNTEAHEYGEIILTGDSLMLEYDHNPEETNRVMQNGWLYTGDIAYHDEDGYVFIVDRKKDVIISGGINIYPREIEEVLARHSAVLESCVIGIPNEDWGETVKAFVVLKNEASETELREFVSIHVADYKRPRIYEFVRELPRNASGKILKQQLRK